MINVVSTVKTNPAPREIHTENVNRFNAASLFSVICLYLYNIRKSKLASVSQNIPSHNEYGKMKAMEECIEGQFLRSEQRPP